MKAAQIKKLLPPLRLKAWLTLALPLALALAFLIAIGGDLQHGLTSTLRSDAPSLYAGAYGEGITKFPDLATWLSWGLDPLLISVALLIVTAALYARTVLLASLLIGAGTFVALTTTDVLALIFADETEKFSGLGVSIAANLLAACAIGVAAVLALKSFLFLWRRSSARTSSLLVFGLGVLVASVAASTLLYLVLFFFFHPTSVHLEARLDPPSRGFFISEEKRLAGKGGEGDSEGQGEPRMFSIIPPRTAAAGAEVTFIDARPMLSWTASKTGARFNAKLTVVTNCAPYRPFEQTRGFLPNWELGNVKSLSLEMDAGQVFAFVDRMGDRDYALDVRGGAMFWLKSDGQSGSEKRSVSAYVQPPSRLSVRGGTPLRFFLTAPLTDTDDEKRTMSKARTMRMKVNGKEIKLVAGGSRKLNKNASIECAAAGPSMDAILADMKGLSDAFLIGVLVEIIQAPDEGRIYLPDGGLLSLAGLAGWVEISEPTTANASDRRLGTANGMSISGNISQAKLDGTEVKFGEDDGLDGFGQFVGYLDDKGFQISGVAEGFWRNQRRVNPTRWERMPTELQATLLAAMGLILIALGRLLMKVLPHLKKDEELFLQF